MPYSLAKAFTHNRSLKVAVQAMIFMAHPLHILAKAKLAACRMLVSCLTYSLTL
jgi:hypothetical protein